MVNRGRGRGTFVSWSPANQQDIDSLNQAIQYYGASKGLCSYELETHRISEETARIFGIPRIIMYCFRRIQQSTHGNLFYAETYFPIEIELPVKKSSDARVLFGLIENYYASEPHQVTEEFSARTPNDKVRKALELSHGLPVLARKRVVRGENGQGIEYTVAYYRGDVCSFLNKYE